VIQCNEGALRWWEVQFSDGNVTQHIYQIRLGFGNKLNK